MPVYSISETPLTVRLWRGVWGVGAPGTHLYVTSTRGVAVKHTKDYDTYINSRTWRARKVAYYATHARVCAACGTSENVHLHHRTYVRMGTELDADLTPLCEAHHTVVHQYHAACSGVSLAKATDVVVRLHGSAPKAVKKKKVPAYIRNGKRSMSPSTKKLVAEMQRAGRKDPVNDALAALRERRRNQPA
jgi:hypothetical protein